MRKTVVAPTCVCEFDVHMVTVSLAVLLCAVTLPLCCCSSCYEEGGCESGPGSSSWLGPLDRLLYRICRECQDNVIKWSDRIFISVKTTSKYHSTRLPPILFTWLQNVLPDQVCAQQCLCLVKNEGVWHVGMM